jgi:hypothetical protein
MRSGILARQDGGPDLGLRADEALRSLEHFGEHPCGMTTTPSASPAM